MAKKSKLKVAAPWVVAAMATGGVLAALAERTIRNKVTTKRGSSPTNVTEVDGIVPQESGAV